jgi:hypothetical protein
MFMVGKLVTSVLFTVVYCHRYGVFMCVLFTGVDGSNVVMCLEAAECELNGVFQLVWL